ncbi:MAG TPA: rhodanese-like domain-containing protein [Pyrinomonadaceae bacterium]
MRLKFAFSFLILGTALFVISCNGVDDMAKNNVPKPAPTTAASTETITADGVRRVTPDELDAMMKNGEVFVADVRSQSMWDAGHIPGAKLIPVGEVANRVSEFPRNKLIVTYCS